MYKKQSLSSKKGEVTFRKKLSLQFKGQAHLLTGHPTSSEFNALLQRSVRDARINFQELSERHIIMSPFLEIGAGPGQASMLLCNEFSAQGFATDISLDTLQLAPLYLKSLGFSQLPGRICCDAYHLPFSDNSIPFIFCYQTLHHFPDPYPVIQEIHRVLTPGGHFFFGEEPVSQAINLNLWRRDHHLKWYEKLLKSIIILHFISRIGKSEVEHNIHEETFSLSIWQNALNMFESGEVTLKAFPYGPTIKQHKTKAINWLTPPIHKNIVLQLLGGGIWGLCRKKGSVLRKLATSTTGLLICPSCPNKSKLTISKKSRIIRCPTCHIRYKAYEDVLLLVSKPQRQELFPHIKS